jgi:hypothetical protein
MNWDLATDFASTNMQTYVLGNCTELFVKDFVDCQKTFMHCSSEGGAGPTVTAISAMCDGSYNSYIFDATGPCLFTNVNSEWWCAFGSYSGFTNACAVISTTNFTGTVRFLNVPLWGGSSSDYEVSGGDIGLELVQLPQAAWGGIQVNGGTFHLINADAYSDPYPFSVTLSANAGISGKTNELIGCFSYYGCTFTNLNSSNPTNVWVDYALSSYNMLGGPPDLALDRPVVVSSTSAGYPAANAVDGNLTTRWSSAYSDPQWIYVDLGTNYNITTVELVWETAYGKAYQIQVSTNATTWTTIYSETNGMGGTEYLTNLSGSGRYVRMYGTERGTSYGYSLWEFEVFGNLADTISQIPPLSIQAISMTQGLTLRWLDNGDEDETSQTNLYYTPNLTPPVVWTPVTNAPILSNGQWIVTLPLGTNGSGFYRLQQ